MALDGIFLYKLKEELTCHIGAHIDKIYQPSKYELVFLLRSKEGAFRLFISLASGSVHLNITENKPENPDKPPMFCMLLRKHLGAARLLEITQNGFERVITFKFSSTNEMGDVISLSLVCEMISSSPNVILCNENGKIIDSLRHSDLETGGRIILPGALYTAPESQNKLNILTVSNDEICKKVLSYKNLFLSKALLNVLDGISPLVANELSYRICGDDILTDSMNETQKMNLSGQINILKNEILSLKNPYLIRDEKGEIKDFCFTEINHLGKQRVSFKAEGYSKVLDTFFSSKEKTARIKKESSDILKLLSNLYARTSKKLLLREKELKNCADREKYRIYGELIKANLYRIKNGQNSCLLENYYDENCAPLLIPLDPALSAAANADKYFKEYKKSFSAERTLKELTQKDKQDLLYIDSVLDALSRVEELSELKEIREELVLASFVKNNTENKQRKKVSAFSPREILFNGFKILIGKNNRQNDHITLNLAAKDDIWLHTKNIPGSHVLIISDGKEVPFEVIVFAAQLAAFYSKAQNSANVAVDYTTAKFVKKPSGAKPGMVIYSKNSTVFVNPDQHLEN